MKLLYIQFEFMSMIYVPKKTSYSVNYDLRLTYDIMQMNYSSCHRMKMMEVWG